MSVTLLTESTETDTTSVAKIGDNYYSELSEAVTAANDGDTIEILTDIALTKQITISGKNITITSNDAVTITGADISTMLKISENASLTLSGNITIDGITSKIIAATTASTATGAIIVNGTLTLEDNIKICNFILGNFAGVISVDGSKAILNINGGTICDNGLGTSNQTAAYSGTIRVSNDSNINMTGGSISNNKLYISYNDDGTISNFDTSSFLYSSSGILSYCSGSIINISGGNISNNVCFRGSAITIYGYDSNAINGELNISEDALITNNSCGKTYYWSNDKFQYEASGAVYLYCWGTINMSGGTISNNVGGMGGGVTIESFWNNGSEYYSKAYFYMTGGTISNNEALLCGGGIYAYSTGVYITGGKIINNTAANLGGAIYSEGNSTNYGIVHLKNVIIHENTAWLEGGGLWTCPTGESELYVTDGGAIYNNTAKYDASKDFYDGTETALNGDAAGDDIASGSQTPHSLTLAKRILGGGSISYYIDGGLGSADSLWPSVYSTDSSEWPYPVVDTSVARYGENTNTDAQSVVNSSEYWALKSEAMAIALAESLATVEIYGNTAKYGGGIGANGGVVIGTDDELMSITVTKEWNDFGDSSRPAEITVNLLNNGTVIDTATLSEDNNWTYTFEDLQLEDGENYNYSVEEIEVDGYTTTISEMTKTADNSYLVTISNTPYVTISGTKTWDDADNAENTRPDSITINLYKNGEFASSVIVTENEDGKWLYSFTNLEKYDENGNEYVYTIVEEEVDGYTATYDGYNITNTYEFPYGGYEEDEETPETIETSVEVTSNPSTGDNINHILATLLLAIIGFFITERLNKKYLR